MFRPQSDYTFFSNMNFLVIKVLNSNQREFPNRIAFILPLSISLNLHFYPPWWKLVFFMSPDLLPPHIPFPGVLLAFPDLDNPVNPVNLVQTRNPVPDPAPVPRSVFTVPPTSCGTGVDARGSTQPRDSSGKFVKQTVPPLSISEPELCWRKCLT